ncbi:MAG: hypothetical protein ACRCZI_15305, partial [Cetobacterium sp.]
LAGAFNTFKQMMVTLFTTIKQQLETVFPGISQAIATMAAQMVAAFTQLKDRVIVTVSAFVAALRDWLTVQLPAIFTQALEAIKAKIAEMIQAFIDLKDQAIAAVAAMVTAIQDWLTSKLNAVFDAVNSKIEAVKQTFADLYDAVVGNSYIPDMVNEIGQWMDRLDANMVRPADSAATKVKGSFENLGSSVGGIFDGIGDSISGLIDGTKSVKEVVSDMLKSIASNLMNSGLNGLFGSSGLGGLFSKLLGGLFGFSSGGSFKVGGAGGIDSQIVAFRASPNETVSINKPGQDMGGPMHVTFGVSADNNGNLMPFVEKVSRRNAESVTQKGLSGYDKSLNANFGARMVMAQGRQL